jgi:ABC-type branched-subunit amino acid transport system substrate-binding protein
MFSTQHSIEAESSYLGSKLNERGVSSVVIIFKENSFSRAHEAAFRSSFKGKIFATHAYTSDDISDLKSIALKVKQLKPDALYVPDAFPLMAGLMKELKAIGVQKKIYSVYSSQSDDVLKVLGADGEGMIYSYPDIGDQEALNYFPTLAAKILVDATTICGNNVQCVHDTIMKQNSFDAHGVLTGKLTLKTIRNGKYVLLNEH